MVFNYCYFERKNYKVLTFYVKNLSYIETSTSFLEAPPSNKRCTLKIQNYISTEGAY